MNAKNKSEPAWIINTSEESFQQDVFERSRELPVVVDFWAEWCQPCRMLAPLLEQMAAEYEGRFVLVKADTEQVPNAATQFGVQSIPAVYGVVGGEIVDFFQGLLPSDQLRAWLDRLLSAAEIDQLQSLEATDPQQAESRYRELLEQAPNESSLAIGLVRTLLKQNRRDEAWQQIEQLEERGFLEPEATKLKSQLQLERKEDLDLDRCRAEAEAAPDDLERQLQLAEALAGERQYEEALQRCLALVEKDRHGVGEKARETMVEMFHVLPDDSDLLREYRRKLSTVLY